MKTKTPKPITAITLAKDVLKWLQPKAKIKIRPKGGNGYVLAKQAGDLQAYLKAGKPCEVCAIGSLICAVAYRIDDVQLADYSPWRTKEELQERPFGAAGIGRLTEYLTPYFSEENLDLIEGAFESGHELPQKFRVASAKQRLKAVMENIVANKGVFVPVPEESF